MKRKGVIKLSHRLLALCTLTIALFVVGNMDSTSTGARAQMFNCEPCNGCTPDSICSCGLHARPTEDFCDGGLRKYSCAGICKPPGGSCTGDQPFCEGTSLPVCNGGQWECDTFPPNCSEPAPYCANGAFCYGGEWYCS